LNLIEVQDTLSQMVFLQLYFLYQIKLTSTFHHSENVLTMTEPLKKSISYFALTMIAVGSCIGSGIFISPSDVASELTTGGQVLLVWAIGGIVALTGALSFGELASRFPGTGGVYIYLREAYGDLVAYLYGWTILTVITSGAIAALCIGFATYASFLFGYSAEFQIPVALTALLLVTVINVIGVKWSAVFSSFMTVLKVLGIGIIVVICLSFGHNLMEHIGARSQEATNVSYGVALVGVLWSYGGWHHASYVGGEVVNAQKVLPRALISGALIVTATYLLVNVGYLSVMTIDEISTSQAVATDALLKVTTAGGMLVAVLIALSTFGTAGIFTLSAPRIYFVMGADKVFFPWLADIHPTFKTPLKAILLQSSWAAVLMVLWGTFKDLTTYVVFMDWIFMTLAAIALFKFRKKYPNQSNGSFRVPLYPIVPAIFIGISLWFLVSTLIGRPKQAVAGIILMILGLPFYFLFKKGKR
jgi:APA family basic amino acid/polyamine antiporter